VGLSAPHLSRLFNTQMGLSITRFRNQQRLQRFVRLYGNGRRTTALAAAHEAGFGSYAQFYRVFRQETGRSPAVLRNAAAYDMAISPSLPRLVGTQAPATAHWDRQGP
jgi:AraC-like DNA-binding protein